jgi:hypothetical protein
MKDFIFASFFFLILICLQISYFFSLSGRSGIFPQGSTARRKSSFHPRFSIGGPDILGINREVFQLIDAFSYSLCRKSTSSIL